MLELNLYVDCGIVGARFVGHNLDNDLPNTLCFQRDVHT